MGAPIRVAQVMGKMNGGGVEAVVMNYYRHIDRTRVQFDFIVDEDSQLCPQSEIEALGGRVITVPPYQRQPANSRSLERLFRDEGYRIVHAHLNTLSVFSLRAAKHAGVPVRIAHSHATMGRGEFSRNIVKHMFRIFANVYPTQRFACSSDAGKWLFGDTTSFAVVPNAIEIGRFAYNYGTRIRLREELGLKQSNFVIGNVGRLVKTKNQRFLLYLLQGLLKQGIDAKMLFVGSGALQANLQHLALQLGVEKDVLFLGQREDVADIYQAMDVFAFPSIYEGFGLALLEAQCAGLPCLISDRIPGEAILSERYIALPIDRGVDEWMASISNLLSNDNILRNRSANASSYEKYDIHRVAKRLTSYYCDAFSDLTDSCIGGRISHDSTTRAVMVSDQ